MTNITIVETLEIVEWGFRQEMSHLILAATAIFFSLLATVAGCHGIYRIYRGVRKTGASILSSLFMVSCTIYLMYAGNDSHKPQVMQSATITFDTYLYDNGSVATNDYPTIRWSHDPLIADDILHIAARPKASTDETDWVEYYIGRVTDSHWSGPMPGCTGMEICVWSEYVPPPTSKINGVYLLDYLAAPLCDIEDQRTWNLLRTPIYDADGGRLMSPPRLAPPTAIMIPPEAVNRFLNNEDKEIHDEQ